MPVSSDTPTCKLVVMFGLVALTALGILSLSWHGSLLDRYEFRQLQTALGAYWIVQDGWQWNYLLPLFGPPWSVPMEFPTYQLLVATLHTITGLPLEQAGRLTSITALFLTLPAVYDLLAVTGLRRSRRLIVLALILSSPVYLFYGRTFMIETTALCLAVWFLAFFRRALLNAHPGWIAAATLAATFAALTKITTFVVFAFPAVALALAALAAARLRPDPRGPILRSLCAALIPVLIAFALTWWWISHSDMVKDSNPFTGFLTARELRAWNFGPVTLRADWSYWVKLQENLVGYNLAEGAIALALLCVPFATRTIRGMAGIALLGFFSGPLIFANLYHIHDYYYAANSLLLTGAAGLLLAAVWDDPRFPRGTNWLCLGLMLAFQWHAFYRGYYSHHRNPAPSPPAIAGLIRDTVPAEDVVLIYGADWNPLLPYYSQRRALMVPGERENETEVLDVILAQLPPRRIAAMIIHGEKLLARPEFIQERAQRFHLAPAPFARSGLDALHLPAGVTPASPVAATTLERQTLPAEEAFNQALKPADPASLDLSIFNPAPTVIRSGYGVNSASLNGHTVLNAHAPSELFFRPAPGASQVHAIVGLPDAAFAADSPAVTDGISVEIYARQSTSLKQRLYHRELDPARQVSDRGPQTVRLDLPDGFEGELIFRLGNGPKGDPTNDWAYWGEVKIR